MKRKIVFIATVLAVFIALSVVSVNALSPIEPFSTGDVNLSYEVTVKDATLIQKYIAKNAVLTKGQLYLADIDLDDDITIKDATLVQKYVAKIIPRFEEYRYFYDCIFPETFNSNVKSGLAVKGEEVTFYAGATYYNFGEVTYEFSVNDQVVQPRGADREFTYTFVEAGTYKVSVNMYDIFENVCSYETDFVVTESRNEEDLYIKSFFYNNNLNELMALFPGSGTQFTAFAGGGSGEYEYRFTLNGEVIQDYSDNNTCSLPEAIELGTNTIGVTVKDKVAAKNITEEIVAVRYY